MKGSSWTILILIVFTIITILMLNGQYKEMSQECKNECNIEYNAEFVKYERSLFSGSECWCKKDDIPMMVG